MYVRSILQGSDVFLPHFFRFRQLILKKVQERINRLFIVSGMNRQKCEKCQACQTEDGKKCIICNKYRSPDTCPNDCCFNPKGKIRKMLNSCVLTEFFITMLK